MDAHPDSGRPGIHVLAKPIGPVCDIKCDYCFYLEKRALFGSDELYRMPDDVLAKYIEQYVAAQPTPVVEFVWHGGEPTLLGLDFFRRVVELQAPFRSRKEIRNTLQTNGLHLDDAWCAFFKANDFFIGISLDGPADIHDRYRKDRHGKGTFERVMAGVRLLQQHGVEFNALACVGRDTAHHPLEVYRFFKEAGIRYIQFTPIVERLPDPATQVARPLAGAAGRARPAGAQHAGHAVDRGTRKVRRLPHRHLRGVGAQGRGHHLRHELRMGPDGLGWRTVAGVHLRPPVRPRGGAGA